MGRSAKIYSVGGGEALDFYVAAARFFDASFWITLGTALLISTAGFVVMRLYVRTVLREGQRSALFPQGGHSLQDVVPPPVTMIGPLKIETERPDRRTSRLPPRSATFRNAETAFRRAAGWYVVGGSIHAATSAVLLFLFGGFSLPSTRSWLTILACCAGVFWSWSFITMIALALFWGPDRRLRGLLALGYLGTLPATGVLLLLAGTPRLPFTDVGLMPKDEAVLILSFASAVMRQPVAAETVTFSPVAQPILFWALSASPVLIPFLAFNRFIRGTVGPLFVNVALLMVLSNLVILDLALYMAPGVSLIAYMKTIFGGSTYRVLTVVSLTLSAFVACAGLLWIAGRYRRRQLSDQTFLFDALWLFSAFYVSISLVTASHSIT